MSDGEQDDADGQATNSSQALIRQVEQELRSDGLEPEQAEKVIRLLRRVAIEKQHRGPLPTAEDFAGYEKAFPGAAKEILGMAIRQQSHAHPQVSPHFQAKPKASEKTAFWRRNSS
jgi:uncharacterized membrane protein